MGGRITMINKELDRLFVADSNLKCTKWIKKKSKQVMKKNLFMVFVHFTL